MRKEILTTILIGNIVDQDLKETVSVLSGLKGVKVADLDLKMSENPEQSSARIIIEADHGRKEYLMQSIKKMGISKGFLVINQV